MEHILSIGIIVIVVIAAVHFVSVYQYRQGFKAGESKGRQDLLIENIARTDRERRLIGREIAMLATTSPHDKEGA